MLTNSRLACALFFAALSLATHSASAQVPSAPTLPKRDVDAEVSRMVKRYGLSDSQTTQVREIMDDETKKIEDVLKDDSLTPMERLTQLKLLRKEETARVSEILDPEQLKQYQKDLQTPDLPPPPPIFQGEASIAL